MEQNITSTKVMTSEPITPDSISGFVKKESEYQQLKIDISNNNARIEHLKTEARDLEFKNRRLRRRKSELKRDMKYQY